jgi:hypothetical protein
MVDAAEVADLAWLPHVVASDPYTVPPLVAACDTSSPTTPTEPLLAHWLEEPYGADQADAAAGSDQARVVPDAVQVPTAKPPQAAGSDQALVVPDPDALQATKAKPPQPTTPPPLHLLAGAGERARSRSPQPRPPTRPPPWYLLPPSVEALRIAAAARGGR